MPLPDEIDLAPLPQSSTYSGLGDARDSKVDILVTNDLAPDTESSTTHTSVKRGLDVRHVQLIAISGAIGAGVFISIGSPLTAAGPLGLLIGLSLYSFVIWCFSDCLIEICTLFPLEGGYVMYAGRFLDPSARFATGWNLFLGPTAFVCFELTALHVVVQYWAPDLNPAVMITIGLVLLTVANSFPVKVYGEVEFWISILKVLLMLGLFLYTFVTMVGGNPLGDRYGFRFWKEPGPFAAEEAVARLRGVWSAVVWGAFAVAGPEFISIVAGEAKRPRKVIPRAYKSTIYRLLFFYIGSAIAVGINCPSDSPELLGAIAAGAPGAAKSPYIINMNRLNIKGLPSLVNVVVLTSIFSTGNCFMYTASRALHVLAIEGQAPRFLARTTKDGVPIFCVAIVAACSCLSYLTLGKNSAVVLTWFVNLTTACTLMNWIVIGFTYLRFRKAVNQRGLHDLLPVKGYLQPYSAYFGTIMACFVLVFSGSYMFSPGGFTVPDLIFSYFGAWFWLFNFSFWKIKGWVQGTQKGFGVPVEDMDFVTGLDEIERVMQEDEEEEARNTKPISLARKVEKALF